MAADAAGIWRDCFARWPADMERRGVLVTAFGEQIPFESFSTSPDLLLIERRAPDTVGARTVIVPYQNIMGLKLVDVIKARTFQALGFTVPAARK
jgi:hypothetical protein